MNPSNKKTSAAEIFLAAVMFILILGVLLSSLPFYWPLPDWSEVLVEKYYEMTGIIGAITKTNIEHITTRYDADTARFAEFTRIVVQIASICCFAIMVFLFYLAGILRPVELPGRMGIFFLVGFSIFAFMIFLDTDFHRASGNQDITLASIHRVGMSGYSAMACGMSMFGGMGVWMLLSRRARNNAGTKKRGE